MKTTLGVKAACALSVTLAVVCFPNGATADITSGGSLDITSGGSLDITSGGALDITSGGGLDITSGGALDITSGGALDITSGGALDITSGGVLDITSGGALDITSGGTLDITSGGALDITSGGALDITSGGGLDITSGGRHVLSGPVAAMDQVANTFESLGQTVWASPEMMASLALGDYVAVIGSVAAPGQIYADKIGEYGQNYVAGASEVFVVGIPSHENASIAELTLGNLAVDYSSALSRGPKPQAPIVEFSGIQPELGGKLLSFAVKAHR